MGARRARVENPLPFAHNGIVTSPRRGRPTLRTISEDLGVPTAGAGWDAWSPLCEFDHPIVRKTADSFGPDPANDLHEGAIRSSHTVQLLEVKQSRWRGAVWIDEATGQPWLVAAGVAKGGYRDHDDFYQRIKRADASGATSDWLPTETDQRQLRRERAAALMAEWELALQTAVCRELEAIIDGGERMFTIPHPKADEAAIGDATITVETTSEDAGRREELLLEVHLASAHLGSSLGWTATRRIIISIDPRETGWDVGGGILSPASGIDWIRARIHALRSFVEADELDVSVPNALAHYSHRRNIAHASVEGKGIRSLCGIFFVPTRDHEVLPKCAECDDRYSSLP